MKEEFIRTEMIASGRKLIHWTEMHMNLLRNFRESFHQTKPFQGMTIGICLHVEPKTAVLCRTLKAGGADVVVTGSPGTTKDEVALALNNEGIKVYGEKVDDRTKHLQNIHNVLQHKPQLLIDNGADLTRTLIKHYSADGLIGCTEETTTGANLLREDLSGQFPVPVIVINDSPLKRIMENEHGVGQTVIEGFMRTTNLIVPTRRFVVIGYGTCGRGIARYLRNLGSQVVVVERDPIFGLEAALNGFRVTSLEDTLEFGQVFITVTGRPSAIQMEHLRNMKDGTILANAGHFSWEIDLEGLREEAVAVEKLTPDIDQFSMPDGRRLILITRGEMVNLAGGSGNPIETMDLGLALQISSLLYLIKHHSGMVTGPQPVPDEVNMEVSRDMLKELLAI
ncbi:adenosylhomocysteinase [Paenibacillus alginolyticus]|uniref:Adenosylhomocysteinase n=1 Tax=Paenibacillus alginolyticus TaxID=59839 RepID=A0ABT4GAJ4_9BACL|nr:adenosylhomocysteinase [Paenibacillus alginolyticus]MCY9693190.1 adenosylhomocysteinase [Paenibacillus alginolyticus]MEC0144515.1 adenosylhomocysteinase [Paenibacillus alginolyticus]